MAKAVVPMKAFLQKFSMGAHDDIGRQLQELVSSFLHDVSSADHGKKRDSAKS